MLIAIAIGISTIVRVSNWLAIESSRRVCAYSIAAYATNPTSSAIAKQGDERVDRPRQAGVRVGRQVESSPSRRSRRRARRRTRSSPATARTQLADIACLHAAGAGPSDPHPARLPTLACYDARSAASPPTRSTNRSRNVSASASTATSTFGGRPQTRRQSVTVSPVVSVPRQLDVDGQRLGPDEARVQGRGDRQRIVDERAVEAVVAASGTPCRSAARRRRSGRSGSRRPNGSRASGPRRGRARASRPASLPGAAGERDDVLGRDLGLLGDVEAERERARRRSVAGRRPGVEDDASRRPDRTWMFHSVVGAVLPATR